MVNGYWIDIAAVVIVSVTANHLGLIAAIERVIRHRLPVVNCPKCLAFWGTLGCSLSGDGSLAALPSCLPRLLAISILCSYIAIWLELLMYAIDTLYNRIYGILEDNQEDHDEDGE
jgi:hypothetical protein